MSKKLLQLVEEIKDTDVKVVSFDIFDTLLMRPCINPTDIFKIVVRKLGLDDNYSEMRIISERDARKRKPFYEEDITLDDIYITFYEEFNIDKNLLDRIKNMELEVEYELLYPRNSGKFLYNTAIEIGKKVIITSDMYLPKEFLEKLLNKNGYTDYSALYVSSEYKLTKNTGNLYKKIIKDLNNQDVYANNILHIGDNYTVDVTMSKKAGLRSLYLPRAVNEFFRRPNLKLLRDMIHNDYDNTFMVGYIANEIFDDPFKSFRLNTFVDGNEENLSKIVLFPVIFSFAKWLIEQTIKDKIDTLLLVYRDGYLPEFIINQLSNIYKGTPQIKRIYFSRVLKYCFFDDENNALFNSFSVYPLDKDMTINDFIYNRLLVKNQDEYDEILKIFIKHGYVSRESRIGDYKDLSEFIIELNYFFVKNAKIERDELKEYYKNIIKGTGKIGLFDIGYRGSIGRFINDYFNKKNICYHMLAMPMIDLNLKEDYKFKVYIKYPSVLKFRVSILHSLLEDVISEPKGSIINIHKENQNNFQLVREKYEPNKILLKIQETLKIFSNKYIELMGENLKYINFDGYAFFEYYYEYLINGSKEDISLLTQLKFKDSIIINNSNVNLYEKWYDLRFGEVDNKRIVSQGKDIGQNNIYRSKKEILKEKIINICRTLKIESFARGIWHIYKDYKNGASYKKKIKDDIESNLFNIRRSDLIDKNNILLFGDFIAFDKGTCNFFNTINSKLKDENLILISEAPWCTTKYINSKINFSCFNVPDFFGKNKIIKIHLVNDHSVNAIINKSSYLKWAVKNIMGMFDYINKPLAEFYVYEAYKYYKEIFNILKPKKIIVWNEFNCLHHIIVNLAKDMNIKVFYFEFGSIPGTFAIDEKGQMGESYSAREVEEFNKIPVTENEFNMAKQYLEYLYINKNNRNIQPLNVIKWDKIIDKNKPNILFAGQTDFESGIFPYNNNSKKYHSPIFKSTNDALVSLAKIAKEKEWNLIYKPHPLIARFSPNSIKVPKNVTYIEQCDINEIIDHVDLVITIVSQVSYIALIRGKPVLMLGYNQLKGKGCTYETYNYNLIVKNIEKALKERYTIEQNINFIQHIARLGKSCLYNDLTMVNNMYGLGINDAIKKIKGENNEKN